MQRQPIKVWDPLVRLLHWSLVVLFTANALFTDPAWEAVWPRYRQGLMVKARQQLGTVGSGNHYVDLFADETGTLWVGVHFGSTT